MKITPFILLILLAWLQYRFWQGPDALLHYFALQDLIARQTAENARLHKRNAALGAETLDLRTGLGAIEARARLELGMIKPGETFYQIVE